MPGPLDANDLAAIDAIAARLAPKIGGVAAETELVRGRLPFDVESFDSVIPTDTENPTTLQINALALQLVRVTGIVCTFPPVGVTQFELTLGRLKMDVLNGGIVIENCCHYLREKDTIQVVVDGVPANNAQRLTLWVWGVQIPATGMIS